jgi:hypothetical protein
MRNVTFLNNVTAAISHVSVAINLDQRTEWKLRIDSSGLDGTPQLFIEEGFTGGKCLDPPTEWNIVCNPCDTVNDSFPINDDIITIEKKDFKGNWFRVRIDRADNTTGNLTVKLGYKTHP